MFDWYEQYELLFARVQLVLFMLGMGATLAKADFARILLAPKFLLAGITFQLLISPVLAVLINHVSGVETGIAVGLLLVAALPGGNLSKLFTYLARGNIALSISLTVTGLLASLATLPLVLRVLAIDYDVEMPPREVIVEVFLCMLLPVSAGMVLGNAAPLRRQAFSRWCIRLGFVLVLIMFTGSIFSGRIDSTAYGWRAPLTIIVFCLLSQQLSMLPFRLLGWPRQDCVAVGIEATMRNINMALLLYAILQPRVEAQVAGGVLFVLLYYAGVALVCGTPLALRYRRMARRAERREHMEKNAAGQN